MSEKIKLSWDQKALDWDQQVGELGDRNRQFNSDPVLWHFLEKVSNLSILDAGCGTGYLSRQLAKKKSVVTGIDISSEMIKIAQNKNREYDLSIDYRVDSVSELSTLKDNTFDKIVSNYVLMDLPDLEGASHSLFRVLKPGGSAVLVMTHPCFPLDQSNVNEENKSFTFHWGQPYFKEREVIDGPWGHFSSEFTYYHRPLSTYWKSFKAAGFKVLDFEEPVIQKPFTKEVPSESLWKYYFRPNSVVFLLKKYDGI